MSRLYQSLRRPRWIFLPLSCLVAAAAVGAFREPPSEDGATVNVSPLDPAQLDRAKVPEFGPPPLAGVTFHANPNDGLDDISVKATRADEEMALSAAREAAADYVKRLTARQDRWLKRALRQGGDRGLRPVRRSVLDAPERYELRYLDPSMGAGGASAPLRGALIGLLVSGLAATLMIAARRRDTAYEGDSGDPLPFLASLPPSAGIAGGVLASVGLVALSSAGSAGAYTFLFIALFFAAAFLYALRGGPRAIRILLIAVIAVAPLRGALLALGDAIDLPNCLLTFNAIQPSLIVACAAAALLAHRSMLRDEPPILVACWLAIAVAAVLDLATQTVGLRLYAIGLAQYLVYPTFALLAWPLLEERDRERVVWAFVALGVLVAVSIFLEVAGVDFAEAVRSSRRFGGATGSYLHSAIFLGTTAVLALGALFSRWSRLNAFLTVAAVGVMVAGIGLTYSRGGYGIAVVGALVLLVALAGRNRLRLVGVTIAATVLGFALSSALGPNLGELASRTSGGASVQGDPGNAKRIASMRETIDEYRALPVAKKAFGKGLASTGNAGKLASQEPDPTESYPLKILVETGAVGLLLIGAVLVWAVVRFAGTSWAAVDPLLKGVGAAGIGLSAESLVYPTLEVQLVSLTWWLLLVLCLKAPRGGGRAPIPFGVRMGRPARVTESEPA
jgi:O-antigen ligase/polysaccharide polymerase Wzy-like membrane protein